MTNQEAKTAFDAFIKFKKLCGDNILLNSIKFYGIVNSIDLTTRIYGGGSLMRSHIGVPLEIANIEKGYKITLILYEDDNCTMDISRLYMYCYRDISLTSDTKNIMDQILNKDLIKSSINQKIKKFDENNIYYFTKI